MVKKLLILVLVLGAVSTANAAVSFYVDGSPAPDTIVLGQNSSITIQVHSTSTANWLNYGIQEDTGVAATMVGSLGSGHTYKGTDNGPDGGNAGEGGSNVWYTESGWSASGYQFVSQSIAGEVVAGIQHSMLYSVGSEVGEAHIGLFSPDVGYSWGVHELDRINIFVPEPMTMGLLGVGALFLRRRRK